MTTLKSAVRKRVARLMQAEAPGIMGNRYIAGKLFPLDPTGPYHILPKPQAGDRAPDGFPIPPEDMREGYGRTTEEYLSSGQRHMASMLEILGKVGVPPQALHRVLDFGCAAGRMLRWFPRGGSEAERWGVDISAEYMSWCQSNLSPPFLFATTTTLPHLPFEDNSFDLVYCGSVFTHVTDLADAWFLELRRVLRKGGHAYITIQDKSSMQTQLSRYRPEMAESPELQRSYVKIDGDPGTSPAGILALHEADRAIGAAKQDYATFAFAIDPFSNIYYDREFIVDKWSRFAEVVSVTPEAYGCQTALLFRKRG